MIKIYFTEQPSPLTFESADAAEVTANGYLRIYWRGTETQDVQLGAVAPGWQYYVIEDAPIPTPNPTPEPGPDNDQDPPS